MTDPAAPAPAPEPSTTILIVDDNPTNRKVLYDYLAGMNHRVLVAEDGETAVEQALYSLPDLILLDIMMPGIDGFETCLRLKKNPATRDIPVIFMTALADTPYIVKGFSVGAVDYLTKPLQQDEVHVRVNTHIQIRRLQRELQREVETRRAAEERLQLANAGKDRFFGIIAHDLKNPMHGAVFFSQTLLEAIKKKGDADLKELAEIVHESASAVGRLLLDLLSWAEIQMNRVEVKAEQLNLGDLIALNVTLAQILARKKAISLENRAAEEIAVLADGRMIDTVVRNLLGNAVKFTPPGGTIAIGVAAGPEPGQITVSVADTGVGIPADKIPGLFHVGQPSTYGTAGESGSGLGLPLCKDMVEKNGGRIWVESEVGKGSTFSFTIPAPGA